MSHGRSGPLALASGSALLSCAVGVRPPVITSIERIHHGFPYILGIGTNPLALEFSSFFELPPNQLELGLRLTKAAAHLNKRALLGTLR